jgi:hypothetical protein
VLPSNTRVSVVTRLQNVAARYQLYSSQRGIGKMQDRELAADDRIRTDWLGERLSMSEINQEVWDADNIVGQGLETQRFADAVGTEPTLLIFLRHFG